MPDLASQTGLPDLDRALDPAAATALLTERWQRAAGRPVAIDGLRRAETELRPGRGCTVSYALSGRVGDRRQATFGAIEVAPSGLTAWMVEQDPALPALAAVLAGDIDGRLPGRRAWHGEPVKYRPGARCVVRLEPADGGPSRFAKLFAAGVERHVEVLRALAEAPGAGVVAPLDCRPELGLLVQSAVEPGTSLGAVALDADAGGPDWMRRAGLAVAALHAVAWRPPGPPATLADDLRRARDLAALFDRLAPAQSSRFAAALAAVEEAAAAHREPAPVTSHGALRASQLLLAGRDRLAMVDLDTCCPASPARDVANLLAYLDWHAVRHPDQRTAVTRATAAFLDGYASVAGPIDPAGLRLHRAASLLKVAGRRLRRLEIAGWPLVPQLLDLAERAATPE